MYHSRPLVDRALRRRVLPGALLIATLTMAGCGSGPVGQSPVLAGTYWSNAQVTNPSGNGPMVVRNGPPQNYNPSARD